MQLSNGTLLQGGKYKIIRFINSGGFGCTYEAVHTLLDKRLAIKEFFVKDYCNRDEKTHHITIGTTSKAGLVKKLREKFIDEAKALCHLSHPGIVAVTDVFEENGTAYFVMDYVDGKSLNEIIKEKGALSERQATDYILQVCDALEYVHSKNRLHLDVKPGNIMIDKHGNAVLIDFGASKQYTEESGENTSTLMGRTPGYAPIEQMANDLTKFYPATDIYALGATFYKMLTGKTPPSASLIASGERPDPLPKNLNKGVYEAIASSMHLKKSERPQTIAQFRELILSQGETSADDEATEVVGVDRGSDKRVDEPKRDSKAEKQKKEKKYDPRDKDASESFFKKNKVVIVVAAAVCAAVIGIFLLTGNASMFSGNNVVMMDSDTATVVEMVTDLDFTDTNGVQYTYSGEMIDGVPNGQGEGIYKEGKYTGTFVNGFREGEATYVTNDGKNRFEGTYKNGMYEKGKLEFIGENVYYEGTFKDNNLYTGILYRNDGSYYGRYEKGKFMQ